MILQLLADVAPGNENETLKTVLAVLGWVTSAAVAVIGALHLKSAKTVARAEGKSAGQAEALQIGPQPFMIEMKEQFITRREFDQFSGLMAVNNTKLEQVIASSRDEMKGLFGETMRAIAAQNTTLSKRLENQNDRLSKKVEEVASGAYQGRQRLHATQNDHTAQIAKLEATGDVATQIGKLAIALTPHTKVQPTHSSNP